MKFSIIVFLALAFAACSTPRRIVKRTTCEPVCHPKFCEKLGIPLDAVECEEVEK